MFDASIEDDEPWLVMEYLPSRSLSAMLAEQGPLDPRLVAAAGRSLLAHLIKLEAEGAARRDGEAWRPA